MSCVHVQYMHMHTYMYELHTYIHTYIHTVHVMCTFIYIYDMHILKNKYTVYISRYYMHIK